MQYEYITEEVMKDIIDGQLKEMEIQHFSLMLAKPSQLGDPQQYQQWNAQKTIIEQTIEKVRGMKNIALDSFHFDEEFGFTPVIVQNEEE